MDCEWYRPSREFGYYILTFGIPSVTWFEPSGCQAVSGSNPLDHYAEQVVQMLTYRGEAILLLGTVAALAAFDLFTRPDDPARIDGTVPQQFSIVSGPSITRHPHPDSLQLLIQVTAEDSTAHIGWIPSVIRLETDRGFRMDSLLVPYACLEPRPGGQPFPHNFEWLSCNTVSVSTNEHLSARAAARLAASMGGRLAWSYTFHNGAGGRYLVEVPVGRRSTAQAIARALASSRVQDAGPAPGEPLCIVDGASTACGPWDLLLVVRYTYGEPVDGALPVGRGGWVRASYVDAGGAVHSARYDIDR